jgi:hypothetical protein
MLLNQKEILEKNHPNEIPQTMKEMKTAESSNEPKSC